MCSIALWHLRQSTCAVVPSTIPRLIHIFISFFSLNLSILISFFLCERNSLTLFVSRITLFRTKTRPRTSIYIYTTHLQRSGCKYFVAFLFLISFFPFFFSWIQFFSNFHYFPCHAVLMYALPHHFYLFNHSFIDAPSGFYRCKNRRQFAPRNLCLFFSFAHFVIFHFSQ